MRYFKTRLHYNPRPSERWTWIYGHRYTSRGVKEIKIGGCYHYWPSKTTHWFVWSVHHSDNSWLRGEHERLHVSQ